MFDELIQEISKKNPLSLQEKNELISLLVNVKEKTEKISLSLTKERWVAIAVHLLAFMRRVKQGESLPPIEQEIWDQVSQEMKDVSQQVLQTYGMDKNQNIENTEIFLLAVHFETAKFEQ
jgi:PRD domain protein (TIGR03582 family)